MMGEKVYKLKTSNKVTYENLSNVNNLVFENVYKEADLTLAKIMSAEKQHTGKTMDSQSLNVISFLGGRGRGKTSAMLSFLNSLEQLKRYQEWSETGREYPNTRYLILPYIDAAMLAEQEFIIDVILAEMWDKFENKIRDNPQNYGDSYYNKDLERKIKKKFEEVRRAYKVSQEREQNKCKYEELPTAGVLHELAVSINLRQRMTELVEDYLCFFRGQGEYDAVDYCDRTREVYLVIAIDDIDMSGKKSYFILEQIRRFMCIPKVIVMLTADIDQLHKTCELRYADIYENIRERQRAVSEYLEKVMPYNMRIYLPELKENHGKILIETGAKEKLGIKSENEKDFILEVMAAKCQLYFDGTRRKRHFLQNQTMRSMVNYFEQLIRVDGVNNYTAWLKTDIKERLIERISNKEQKAFMEDLLTKDYEDMNSLLLGYIRKNLKKYQLGIDDTGLGEVLYACNLFELEDPENMDFVNCVIMLYSVIMLIDDAELKEKIWGDSIFGEWEYGVVQAASSDLCQGFSSKVKLEFLYNDELLKTVPQDDIRTAMDAVVRENGEMLLGWVCMLLFVTIVTGVDGRIDCMADTDEKTDSQNDKKKYYITRISPEVSARKNFLSCAYMNNTTKHVEKMLCRCLEELGMELSFTLYGFVDSEKKEIIQNHARELTANILERLGLEPSNEMGYRYKRNFRPQVIEFIYNIGKELDQVTLPETNNEEDCYRTLVLKYKIIYEKLKRIDEYYKKNIKRRTHFADEFRETPQAKLLFGDLKLVWGTRAEFEDRMGELLLEAKRVAILTPPSR